ncbi:hypothetical protein GFY24_28585 [Nocardia sp. SYP-A9097]|uniref:condensation domain-containing protein n=1 Tax=Nocardia sp. SYP-A9097 TaxID=2663237 RepID=UPI00129BFEBD|nr:condensation domain-containing protein [Nocardia sp. SYP-A9097]MRH91351.1 hypothetical protein [Nocardia sp. SYP-A9097]
MVLTHAGLTGLIAAQGNNLPAGPGDCVLCVTTPTFDASIWELLLAGAAGAALIIAPDEVYAGPPLAGLIRRERVTHAFITALVPMSYAQQRLWPAHLRDPDSAAFNMLLRLRLIGAVDVSALTAALTDVVERHEALRTSFEEVDGVVWQRISPVGTVVAGLVAEDVAAQDVDRTLYEFGGSGFDLAATPPILLRLLRIHDPKGVAEQHILAVLVHHVIADGLSLAPCARDLAAAYPARARSAAPEWAPLPVQYADYTLWQREVLGAATDPESELSRQLGYWSEVPAGLPVASGLPPHRPRPARPTRRAGRVDVRISGETAGGLREVARRHGATMFMVVHAGLSALPTAVSGGSDIAVGTPVAGRGVAPFEHAVDAAAAPRTHFRHPLFQVMLSSGRARTPNSTCSPPVSAACCASGTTPAIWSTVSLPLRWDPTVSIGGPVVGPNRSALQRPGIFVKTAAALSCRK